MSVQKMAIVQLIILRIVDAKNYRRVFLHS